LCASSATRRCRTWPRHSSRLCRGQGGIAQGIGWALNEEYIDNKDGKVENPGFLDYCMPVCSDLPMSPPKVLDVIEG
jgi:hypothetical protein